MMNTMIGASIFAVLTFSFPVANANMALAQTAQDRVLTIGKPEEVGMSKSVLNAATSLYSESVAAWVDPNREIVGIILTQNVGGRNPGIEFVNVVNSALQN